MNTPIFIPSGGGSDMSFKQLLCILLVWGFFIVGFLGLIYSYRYESCPKPKTVKNYIGWIPYCMGIKIGHILNTEL
jgi:hypothetical protein